MKLLEQILDELGADTLKSFTIVPAHGGYFRSVKAVAEFSPRKIVLVMKKSQIVLEGENMQIGKYFQEDIYIEGDIRNVKID